MGEFVRCPLCGSLVKPEEVKNKGYCQLCELLIEALKGRKK